MAKDNIEEIIENVNLTEKSEMEGVADQIFQSSPTRSNITHDETSACFKCNAIFPVMGMDDENPVSDFLELKKSQLGWSTEKFVQCTSGINDQRSGGMFKELGSKLFKPNQ